MIRHPESEMVRAILRRYESAETHQLARGRRWYGDARALCRVMAAGTPFTARQVAAVIAALSPRQYWDTNVESATTLVDAAAKGRKRAPKVPGFTRDRGRAWTILRGARPGAILGGPKVRAFWANLCGDDSRVTVDIWASRAAEVPIPNDDAQYARIANAYVLAASRVGLAPAALQAIVWLVQREHSTLHGQTQLAIGGRLV